MAVSEHGEVVGSVSGGCVEGAVYDLAMECIASGTSVVQTYGVSDDDAFGVGLTCGGVIEILVEPSDGYQELPVLFDAIRAARPIAVATVPGAGRHLVVGPDASSGTLGDAGLDVGVTAHARGMLAQGRTGVVHIGRHGEQRHDELTVFVQSFSPPPRMIVFGAIDFAGAVARIGKYLGYHVTVCDARPVFATPARFPDADEVVVAWPHHYLDDTVVDERTVLCVLTHDPKFDVPVLERALRTRAAYIGAMGSRRTHEDRIERLRAAGLDDAELARLSSPIGLDLGARTPEETAVAIAAEIIGLRWGGTGRRLRDTDLDIHR